MVLVSLGMCEVSYKPQDVGIGFIYNIILDGRIVGCIPETLTELFILKLRTLKIQGKRVNKYFKLFCFISTHNYIIISTNIFII